MPPLATGDTFKKLETLIDQLNNRAFTWAPGNCPPFKMEAEKIEAPIASIQAHIASLKSIEQKYENIALTGRRKTQLGTSLDMDLRKSDYMDMCGMDAWNPKRPSQFVTSLATVGSIYQSQQKHNQLVQAVLKLLPGHGRQADFLTVSRMLDKIEDNRGHWQALNLVGTIGLAGAFMGGGIVVFADIEKNPALAWQVPVGNTLNGFWALPFFRVYHSKPFNPKQPAISPRIR